jgi:hypothetical protein
MPETTITTDGKYVTLVNVFTCAEQRQHELVEAIDKATAEVFVHQPGFISANIHASRDQTRVLNYAQWASVEDLDAMQSNRDVQEQMAQIISIAESVDPRLYDVKVIHHL